MSLLQQASLIVTPNAYKEGKLYSVIPSDGSGDLSVTRATTATRMNSAGLVEFAPYNLLSYSEQFDNPFWGKTNITVTVNAGTAPNGTLTADRITATADSATINQSNVQTVQIYTHSVWVRAESGTVSGSIYGISSFATRTDFVATTEWQRITNTALSLGSNRFPTIRLNTSGTSILIWGAQLVEGTEAKDYFATETRLNIPRLDYSLGGCPSILVEPQRTNLMTYSEQLNDASWTKTECSITANIAASPSGILNADKIIPNTTNTFHPCKKSITVSSGLAHAYTVYLKKDGYNYVLINTPTGVIGGNVGPVIDLNNGTIVGNLGGSTHNAVVTSINDGWYKVTMTFTTTGTTTIIDINTLATSSITSYSGNGTDGILVWGAQLEAGAYPTSYIPTTSASVTRNADVISKTGISSLLNPSEGTLFVEAAELKDNANKMFQITNGTDLNVVSVEFNNNTLRVGIIGGGGGYRKFDIPTNLYGFNKIAIGWISGNISCFVNGVQYTLSLYTGSGDGIPTQLDRITFSYWWNGSPFYTNTKSLAIWKTRLTDGELSILTSGIYTPELAYAAIGLTSESPACLESSINAIL